MRQVMPWLVLVGLLAPGRGAITGQVLASDGQPVAGAKVSCVPDPRHDPAVTVVTGPDGRFTFELKPELLAPLERSAPPEQPVATVVATADGYGLDWSSCTRERLLHELRLSPSAALDVPFVDPEGRPLAGVAVGVAGVGTSTRYTDLPAHGIAGLSAVTDARGVAHFTGLPRHAVVRLVVEDRRFAQLSQEPEEAPRTREQPVATAEPIELAPGATVRGRVLDGRSGRPVAGAVVFWWGDGGLARGRGTTDATGDYAIQQLPPGTGTLAIAGLPVDGCAAPKERLPLKEGEELTGQDFTVVDGVPLTIRVEAEGRPVPLAILGVTGPQLPEAAEDAVWPPLATGDDGQYTLRVLPGRQRVSVYAGHRLPDYAPAGARSETIDVRAGAPATLVVRLTKPKPGPAATVRVIDPEGKPVAGAEVDVWPSWTEARLTTNAEGECRVPLVDRQPPTVRARLGRLRSVGWSRVSTAAVTVLTVAERRLFALEVLVQDPAGKPLAGVPVTLVEQRGDSGGSAGQAMTDAAGHAAFADVEADGSYVVIAGGEESGYGQGFAKVAFTTDRATCPPVALPVADQPLAGWVLDAEGRPVAQARVSVHGGGSPQRETITNRKGEFRVTGLAKGKVQVFACDREGKLIAHTEVEAGDENVILQPKPTPGKP